MRPRNSHISGHVVCKTCLDEHIALALPSKCPVCSHTRAIGQKLHFKVLSDSDDIDSTLLYVTGYLTTPFVLYDVR